MSPARSPDTPSLGQDRDRLTVNQPPASSNSSGEGSLDALTDGALEAMTGGGDGAERAYQSSLARLRGRDDAPAAIAARYDTLDESQYQERWALIQLLTDLVEPSSLTFFSQVLDSPIPPERGEDLVHGISTVAEEVILRTTIIEALSRLVSAGSGDAAELLMRQLGSDVLSIRRAAVQAVLDAGDEALVERVRRQLQDTDDAWLLRARRAEVGSVHQPDPRRDAPARPAGEDLPPEPFAG